MDTNSPEVFLENLITSLVDHPEDVKISRTVDEMGVLLTLDLNPEDMGKVIGRKGATAKAIRTLLRVVGMKNQARVNLKINEPEGREPRPQADHNGDDNTTTPEAQPEQPAPQTEAAPVNGADITAEMDAALEDLKSDL